MPALFPFKGYDNSVIEKKIDSLLETKLDVNRFLTADYSLAEQPGMVKKIRSYTGTLFAEDLARGEGSTDWVDAEYVEREYRVVRTQSPARWYDDDLMTDPMLIDAKVKYVAESMVNDWTKKAIAEFGKTSNQAVMTNWDAADFAQAIAKYRNIHEDTEGLFFLINTELVPQIQNLLLGTLQYTEGYIRNGAVGVIYGVPIYDSVAVPKGLMFLATRDAVHAFLKKQTFVEGDHDPDTKLNRMFAAKYSVIALYDETQCIACGAQNAQATTITTSAAGAAVVAGAAPTGAKVSVYVNDKLFGVPVVAAGNAYSVTGIDNLEVGDRIRVVAELEEYLPGIALAIAA